MKRFLYILSVLFCMGMIFASCEKEDTVYGPAVPLPQGIVAGEPAADTDEFEVILDDLREQLLIPGISAAIAKEGNVVWAEGFGYADRAENKRAEPTTLFHLASLTKTYASTILMQLVEAGELDLNAPVSDFGITLTGPDTIRVIHLFTHTSEGYPGVNYRYSGNRYAYLDQVVEGVSGRTFCDLLMERIIGPLTLEQTVPNLLSNQCPLSADERTALANELAQGYDSNGEDEVGYPMYFGVSAGLIASVVDVARYSLAIDANTFLSAETQEQVFTSYQNIHGQIMPYGLGWFVQTIQNVKVVWHYGWWTGNSSLIIKVPEMSLTFVVAANTDMLSRGFPSIGNGDITVSAVANEFLNAFIFGNGVLPDGSILKK